MKRTATFLIIGLVVLTFGFYWNETAKAQGKSLLEKYLPKVSPIAGVKRIPQLVETYKMAGAQFERRELFETSARPIDENDGLRDAVNEGILLDLNKTEIRKMLKNSPQFLSLSIPDGKGGMLELELYKSNILSEGFKVTTSSPTGEKNLEEYFGIHYRGIIKGNLYSLAGISIFKNEMMGIIRSKENGTQVLGRLEGNNPTNRHILYAEKDLKYTPTAFCNVKDTDTMSLPSFAIETEEEFIARCVRIYIEANNDLFINKGSVANTTAYITGLFNQSAILYANDGISVAISEIFVWTSQSPYTGANSEAQLNLFRTTRTSFNGDLAHLLTLQSNYGGIAWVDVLCNTSLRYAFSGINATYQNVPTYSWSVMVFTHETGHNLGSPHTHACAWNGNNTAIDGCWTTEGGCANPGIPAGGGTIMSYCHLQSVGINLSLGFGTQPRALIQNRFNAATCLTDCGGGGGCPSTAISFGQNVNGSLTTSDCIFTGTTRYVDVYNFSGTAGQQIAITMNSTAFDTYLYLLNSSNQIITEDDDGGGGTNSRIPPGTGFFTLPSTGTYTIWATSFSQGSTGTYSLNLTTNAPNACDQISPIALNQSINGSLAATDCLVDNKYTDKYSFSGTAGQQIVVTMNSGTMDSYLRLYNSSNQLIASDDDGGGGLNSRIPPGSGSFVLPTTGTYRIEATTFVAQQTGSYTVSLLPGTTVAATRKQYDFDGDNKSDVGIYRPSNGQWWINRSSNGSTFATTFGISTDRIAPLDYTGDSRADIAVFRPSNGNWNVLRSNDFTFYGYGYGVNGDIPASGFFDNDNQADTAVFRPSNATWYIRRSTDGGSTILQFGANGDIPVVADYDGDGRDDIAIYRPSNGQWWINRSSLGVVAYQFGVSTDKPIAGDFTGDGKADVAFWRPSTGEWYVLRSENQTFFAAPFGISSDIPLSGDFDGDGRNDFAVFRPSNNVWYINRTSAGFMTMTFGASGDKPVPSAFIP